MYFSGGSEDGSRVKRVRADSSAVAREPAQALDAPDPEQGAAPAPPAFLSPSVKEYLELGMAIPGKLKIIFIVYSNCCLFMTFHYHNTKMIMRMFDIFYS